MAQSDVHYNAAQGRGASSRTAARSPTCARSSRCIPSRSRCWRARKPASPSSRTSRASASTSAIRAPARAPRWRNCSTALGWKTSDFSLASELKADEHGPALCDNKIDGFYYGVGHPSADIQDPTTSCGAKLIALDRAGGRQADRGQPLLRQGHHPGRHVCQQSEPDRRPMACWRRSSPRPRSPTTSSTIWSRRCSRTSTSSRSCIPAFANLDPQGHGQGRPVGAAASGRREVLQGKGLDEVKQPRLDAGPRVPARRHMRVRPPACLQREASSR